MTKTVIYERDDQGRIYSREFGSSERKFIGHDSSESEKRLIDLREEKELWYEIRQAAKTNPGLQAELDRVKMLYYLIKKQNG